MVRLSKIILIALSLLATAAVRAEHDYEPETLSAETFDKLVRHSPFQRLVSVKDTYELHAVSKIGERTLATLHHRITKRRIIVRDDQENEAGMRLLSVAGGSNPRDVVVTIKYFEERAELGYGEKQLKSEPVPRFKHTVRKDREGRPVTTEELVKKYYSMNQEQRNAYNRWKSELLKRQPKLEYSEKRFPMAHKALDAIRAGKKPPTVR